MKNGILVTLEGLDGVGKSTHCKLLCSSLTSLGKKAVALHEPGTSELGKKIRKMVVDNEINDSWCEFFLFLAARRSLINTIKQYLTDNYVVIMDRFVDSTIAYQIYGKQLFINSKLNMQNIIDLVVDSSEVKPNITFLLESSSTSMDNRIRSRDEKMNHFDLLDESHRKLISDGFLYSLRNVYKNDRITRIINSEETIKFNSNFILETVLSVI